MRSTLSFEPEVHRLVLKAMHDNQTSFKATVNEAIRRGLSNTSNQRPPFVVKAARMGLLGGIDPQGMNRLLDDLLSDDTLDRLACSAESVTSREAARQTS